MTSKQQNHIIDLQREIGRETERERERERERARDSITEWYIIVLIQLILKESVVT